MSVETHIRPIGVADKAEIELVARRMRDTLAEVLGPDRGDSMYSHTWLVERVLWHLDPDNRGQVFVARSGDDEVTGHTIVRVDLDADGSEIGLFSTTYVHPDARRSGVAAALLQEGEAWMRARGLQVAVTYTDPENTKLQTLYQRAGYTLAPMPKGFVSLTKRLNDAA